MHTKFWTAWMLVSVISATAASSVSAGVVVQNTRVVYPAHDREVTVHLTSKNDRPVLVQAWLDAGDANAAPESIQVPFLLTPPLFRMEAGGRQVLRILHTGESMPVDRESLYWLNVYEIPAQSEDEGETRNLLKMAVRTRLKLFYRPQALPGSAAHAPSELRWAWGETENGSAALQVENPSPYYVNLFQVQVLANGQTHEQADGSRTIAPFGSVCLTFKGVTTRPAGNVELLAEALNDYGGRVPLSPKIAH